MVASAASNVLQVPLLKLLQSAFDDIKIFCNKHRKAGRKVLREGGCSANQAYTAADFLLDSF